MNCSHKTAITRSRMSSPARYLKDNSLLKGRCLDYGCGKGKDVEELSEFVDIMGYDPYYRKTSLAGGYNTIMCNFVLNVIPDEYERQDVITTIKSLLVNGGVAYISVRNDKKNLNGWTSKGTWQGFIELNLPVVKKTSSFVMYKLEK